MKNFLLCILVQFLLFSCSTEEVLNPKSDTIDHVGSANASLIPSNKANPYDQTGLDYYNELSAFTDKFGQANSAQELTEQMLFLSGSSDKVKGTNKSIITLTPEMVALILSNPQAELIALIENSALSLEIKNNLIAFVVDLVTKQNDDYDVVYSFIVAYEATVIQDVNLQEDEKDTILKVSAVSRYSLYAEAQRRDRDWETAVTNKNIKPLLEGNEVTLTTMAVLFRKLE